MLWNPRAWNPQPSALWIPCEGRQEATCRVAQARMHGPNRSYTWIPRVCAAVKHFHLAVIFLAHRSPRQTAPKQSGPTSSPQWGVLEAQLRLPAQSVPAVGSELLHGARAPHCDRSENCMTRGWAENSAGKVALEVQICRFLPLHGPISNPLPH